MTAAQLRYKSDVSLQEATPQELHEALSQAVMMSISENWTMSKRSRIQGRKAHYFSAEYLIGRLVDSNLYNLGILDELMKTFLEVGVDLACMEDIEDASMKVMAGPEKKSRVVTPEEKKLTAYHEAGHAVAGFYCKHHPRVHEITIIPRGQAGGYTMYLPEKDRSYVTKGEMFEDIVSSLGGRVAEQLILEDISTGASNDLQQATNIARQMITRYGFSERLGPVVYGTSQEETFLGRDFGQGKGYSETTAAEIDSETRDIIDEAYETCRRTLTEHIDQLHALAKALMEREKLNEEQFNTIMAGGTLPPCEDAKPEQAQPDQTVQPAPVQPAEPAETAERAEPAEQAEPAQPEMPQPDAPEQQD